MYVKEIWRYPVKSMRGDPAITRVYDVDSTKAASVRERAFADFAKDRTLIAVPHAPFPGVGLVRRQGSAFEWVPIIYGNRLG